MLSSPRTTGATYGISASTPRNTRTGSSPGRRVPGSGGRGRLWRHPHAGQAQGGCSTRGLVPAIGFDDVSRVARTGRRHAAGRVLSSHVLVVDETSPSDPRAAIRSSTTHRVRACPGRVPAAGTRRSSSRWRRSGTLTGRDGEGTRRGAGDGPARLPGSKVYRVTKPAQRRGTAVTPATWRCSREITGQSRPGTRRRPTARDPARGLGQQVIDMRLHGGLGDPNLRAISAFERPAPISVEHLRLTLRETVGQPARAAAGSSAATLSPSAAPGTPNAFAAADGVEQSPLHRWLQLGLSCADDRDRVEDLVGTGVFGEEAARTCPQRRQDRIVVRVGGQDHDRNGRRGSP